MSIEIPRDNFVKILSFLPTERIKELCRSKDEYKTIKLTCNSSTFWANYLSKHAPNHFNFLSSLVQEYQLPWKNIGFSYLNQPITKENIGSPIEIYLNNELLTFIFVYPEETIMQLIKYLRNLLIDLNYIKVSISKAKIETVYEKVPEYNLYMIIEDQRFNLGELRNELYGLQLSKYQLRDDLPKKYFPNLKGSFLQNIDHFSIIQK